MHSLDRTWASELRQSMLTQTSTAHGDPSLAAPMLTARFSTSYTRSKGTGTGRAYNCTSYKRCESSKLYRTGRFERRHALATLQRREAYSIHNWHNIYHAYYSAVYSACRLSSGSFITTFIGWQGSQAPRPTPPLRRRIGGKGLGPRLVSNQVLLEMVMV